MFSIFGALKQMRSKKQQFLILIPVLIYGILYIYATLVEFKFWKRTYAPSRNISAKQDETRERTSAHTIKMPYEAAYISKQNMDTLNDNVTIVTAYFNLGTFQKGKRLNYTADLYRKRMAIFEKIRNPLVAYFDSDEDFEYFSKLRRSLKNLTLVYKISREELWSFSLRDKIKKIYSDLQYPVYYPDTVNENYTSAVHAKTELTYQTLVKNPFKTRYFAWVDIGYFRNITPETEPMFELYLPKDFNDSKIAFTEVMFNKPKFRYNLGDAKIFLKKHTWIGGGYFLGRVDVMVNFTVEYLNYTEYFLQQNLSGSEQQIYYAMYSNHKPKTEIQTYFKERGLNKWFYLGFLCKEQGRI